MKNLFVVISVALIAAFFGCSKNNPAPKKELVGSFVGDNIKICIYNGGTGNNKYPDLMTVEVGKKHYEIYGEFRNNAFCGSPSPASKIPTAMLGYGSGDGDLVVINNNDTLSCYLLELFGIPSDTILKKCE